MQYVLVTTAWAEGALAAGKHEQHALCATARTAAEPATGDRTAKRTEITASPQTSLALPLQNYVAACRRIFTTTRCRIESRSSIRDDMSQADGDEWAKVREMVRNAPPGTAQTQWNPHELVDEAPPRRLSAKTVLTL